MTLRIPLYGRVLGWFALNLALLAAVLALVARSSFPVEALLEGLAGERVQRLGDVLIGELRTRPLSEWDDSLARASAIYGVDFILIDERESVVAGRRIDLPEAVRARLHPGRLRSPREPRPLMAPTGPNGPNGPAGPVGFGGPGGPRGPMPPPVRTLLRAGSPASYWAVLHTPFVPEGAQRPLLARLVVRADRLVTGGVFLDPKPWLAGIALALLVSALWWAPFVRSITRAVRQMTTATEQVAQGRFDARVDDSRGDELGRMGGAINQMASRLETLVAGQKRFLGDVAHELCSPLARMEMALGILEQRSDARSKEYVGDVREEVRQMSALVNELLSFSKAALHPSAAPLQRVPLAPLVAETLRREALSPEAVELDVPPDLAVTAEPELLLRALSNLVRNAVRYAGDAGPVRIEASPAGTGVRLRVLDCGPGVSEAELPRLTEPFYRPDTARTREKGGTGLGLAIVRSCVEACRGELHLRNRQPRGFEAEIRLGRPSG